MLLNSQNNVKGNFFSQNDKLVKRYEKKFEISNWKTTSLKGFLLSKGFHKNFPNRIVNSLYYEDEFLNCFSAAQNGENFRYKIRLRFYNRGDKGYHIEKKVKQEEQNWKKLYDLESQCLGRLLPIEDNSKKSISQNSGSCRYRGYI